MPTPVTLAVGEIAWLLDHALTVARPFGTPVPSTTTGATLFGPLSAADRASMVAYALGVSGGDTGHQPGGLFGLDVSVDPRRLDQVDGRRVARCLFQCQRGRLAT